MLRAGRRLADAALAVLVIALILPLTTFLVAAWLMGWQLQSVQSGSMAPTYPVGSLLVVGAMDAADVRPGMAVVFEDPGMPGRVVTHRVVGQVAGDALAFWTQGDANPARDPEAVPARLVRGRVLWHVTHLGTLTSWLQGPAPFVALVLVPGALLFGLEWRSRRGRPRGEEGSPAPLVPAA
jgi:signal peptidase I